MDTDKSRFAGKPFSRDASAREARRNLYRSYVISGPLLIVAQIGAEVMSLEEVEGAPLGAEFDFKEFSKDDLSMIYLHRVRRGNPKVCR